MSVGRFSMTAEDFGKYQKFIEEACLRSQCTKDELKARTLFIKKMKEFNKGIKK